MSGVTVNPEGLVAAAQRFLADQPGLTAFPAVFGGTATEDALQAAIAAWPGIHVGMHATRQASAEAIAAKAAATAAMLPATDEANAETIDSVDID